MKLDWSSQQVLTNVLFLLFKSQNIESEIIDVPIKGQWFYLHSGKADIQVEVWEGTMAKSLQELLTSNRGEVAATHNISSREGWWYPAFVEDLCPGLPSWKALLECKGVFVDEYGTNTYYAGPWEKSEYARVRALKLPFRIEQLKDGDAINQKIVNSMNSKTPVLIFNWFPNWIWQVYDGKFIEFPEYSWECEVNASWGVNPKYAWDCDNPKNGWLRSVVSSSLKTKSLCAYRITRSFILNGDDLSHAAYLVDAAQMSVEQAAQAWLETNHSRINEWVGHPECLINE